MQNNSGSLLILLVMIVLNIPAELRAQDYQYKGEVYALAGIGGMLDDETNLGQGLVVGGGVGYRFHRRWGVSFDVSRNEHHRDFGTNLQAEGHAVLVGGSAQFFFRPETSAQPYLRAGVNYARYRGTFRFKGSTLPGGLPVPGIVETGSQAFFGPDFGCGVRLFVTRKLSIRPEVRFAAHDGLHKYDFARDILEPRLWVGSLTVGLGYHW